jgi:hypothetical protein
MGKSGGGIFRVTDGDFLEILHTPEIPVLTHCAKIEARDAERLRALGAGSGPGQMNQPADVLARNLNGGRGKEKNENAVQLVAGGEVAKIAEKNQPAPNAAAEAVPTKPEDMAGWKEFVEDTRINESVRRGMIHQKLAEFGRVKPEEIKKWLFKEVLAADLDDPTIGIGELLNKRYPFAEEDAKRK